MQSKRSCFPLPLLRNISGLLWQQDDGDIVAYFIYLFLPTMTEQFEKRLLSWYYRRTKITSSWQKETAEHRLIVGIGEKNIFARDPATLVFIKCIINESKLHLSCSLADLVTVSHLHCVALLYWENLSRCELQETQSGHLEQSESQVCQRSWDYDGCTLSYQVSEEQKRISEEHCCLFNDASFVDIY